MICGNIILNRMNGHGKQVAIKTVRIRFTALTRFPLLPILPAGGGKAVVPGKMLPIIYGCSAA